MNNFRQTGKRRGFFLPLVLLAGLCIAFFVLSVSSLSRSYRDQINHTNRHQLAFTIAYSAFSAILSQCYSVPWPERPFLNAPVVKNGMAIFDGEADTLVHNTPGRDNMADIYVRVKCLGLTKLFFWRVEHIEDLLDITGSFKTIWFAEAPLEMFPNTTFPFAAEVDRLMTKRAANRDEAERKARELAELGDIREIAQNVGVLPPDHPEGFEGSGDETAFGTGIPVEMPQPVIADNPEPKGPKAEEEIPEYRKNIEEPLPTPPTRTAGAPDPDGPPAPPGSNPPPAQNPPPSDPADPTFRGGDPPADPANPAEPTQEELDAAAANAIEQMNSAYTGCTQSDPEWSLASQEAYLAAAQAAVAAIEAAGPESAYYGQLESYREHAANIAADVEKLKADLGGA